MWVQIVLGFIFLASGIRIVRPTGRGVVETLGKYSRYVTPGFNWIFPVIQHMILVDITERMEDIESQEIITKDNLNAKVDLVAYYKVRAEEESLKKVLYNVSDFQEQIVSLAQTTARNVIGTMKFTEVNNQRNKLNEELAKIMDKETNNWGIAIVRIEMKEINPPVDVQESMNKIIKAENEKDAAIDFATSVETAADGKRRAAIKEAEGLAKGKIIVAEGKAKAIELVNVASHKFFIGNAQKLKQLEVAENSLSKNSKIILGDNANSVLKLLNLEK